MRTELERPRAHLVVDDFFPPEALAAIFRELPALRRKMEPGLAREVGHDGQSVFFAHPRRQNRAVWAHDPSKTLDLFREHFWSEAMTAMFEGAREPLFQIIPNCSAPHVQVSSYMTGDHYDFHEDEGAGVNLTAVVFLAEDPSKVRGGDLEILHDGELAKVRFRNNRLVVFPSKTLHRVTRVKVASEDPRHARISLQAWLTFGRPEAGAKKPKARAPEADRPTFLLAEEPILAAAQATLPGAGRDLTPDEVYWGGFYVSRILTQNLRRLLADHPALAPGAPKIRHADGLEVFVPCRLGDQRGRFGFALAGPEVDTSEALRLFVETSGKGGRRTEQRVSPGADEREVVALAKRLVTLGLRPGR